VKQISEILIFYLVSFYILTISSCASTPKVKEKIESKEVSTSEKVFTILANERIVQGQYATLAEQHACANSGGEIISRTSVFGNSTEICHRTYEDANKACNDSSECDGLCIYSVCSAQSNPISCFGITIEGKLQQICVD